MGYIMIDGEKFYTESKCYKSIIEGNKKYRERNKDKINKKNREYRQKEKEKDNKDIEDYYKKTNTQPSQCKIKYFKPSINVCECGSVYKYLVNKQRHLTSKKHQKYINNKTIENNLSHILNLNDFND